MEQTLGFKTTTKHHVIGIVSPKVRRAEVGTSVVVTRVQGYSDVNDGRTEWL